MATLKEQAQAYESPKTLNIAELESVSVDVEIKEETRTRTDGEEFTIMFIEVDGKKYRVPKSVISGLNAILDKMPDVLTIRVLKTGEGKDNTRYQVVPLDVKEQTIQTLRENSII